MKIGFIGLGIMGRPMSKNLLKAGYELVIYDRNKWKRDEVIKEGAEEGTSPKDVASRSDVIITMLPNSPQVKEVVLGNGGVIEGAKEGSILIDMSSIAPLASREVSEKLAEKKIRMMDAPVSGGEPKAIDGTLSIMVGGEERDFEQCLPILKTMGSSAVLCGEIGAGNVTKLANQIMVAVNIAGMSEALVLAAKSGVSPEKVYNAVRGGLAGSTVLDAKAPLIMDRKFDPGFRIDLHIKDLGNVIETGHGVGVPLPLTSSVMEMFQALKVDGLGSEDHGALVKFYEKLSHIEVTR
ncbi:2-hydroxy-3-oxopropionate reductase [Sporanaerobacter sp. PP17-6a]|uniref:2-hydroxy-3-oxopropionate reductase n=1 Tax=Sporanaerobacter sp. PP17-6a TaxID=1891289 RepID=UPI00089FE6DD|nr:2-hydroxy-3-oxopropionate reductase [Sporanaerobacter sp. PP17-6a]SCL91625.1 2-hydroxy-3-oxopropionate reductase [Sporanaerobacter sp. PP17-6a]